jgi:type VI secretion system protein VasG
VFGIVDAFHFINLIIILNRRIKMSEIQRSALFEKLNKDGYKTLEGATVFCKLNGNPYVELVHWINQILQLNNCDLQNILRYFEINSSRLASDITLSLERLPKGATSISDLSLRIDELMEQAWLYTSLLFKAQKVRCGHLIIAALKTVNLRNELYSISAEFKKIKLEQLIEEFAGITKNSEENSVSSQYSSTTASMPGESSGSITPAAMGKQEALKKYASDLTEKARKGEIDPVLGRDEEIRLIVDILMRRKQNNPILTGEAGVGKTAVVEGLALKIANKDVPPPLLGVSLKILDIGLLQAGASMKGEFEERLKQVIEEVQSSSTPIILFIDEAHTLIGAGGSSGTGDAANLLKPALARGELKTIAATTWSEYKKYIEKDPALTRRFQIVKIEEPSEKKAVLMLRGLAATFEEHHKILLLDEAIEAAVNLSHRYINGRQLPDKAVSLLDTACARTAVSHHAKPSFIEDLQNSITGMKSQVSILEKETEIGINHNVKIKKIKNEITIHEKELEAATEKWDKEKKTVQEILDLRKELRKTEIAVEVTEDSSLNNKQEKVKKVKQLQKYLEKLQGENPLIMPCVNESVIGSIVSDWTGIPAGRMVKNEVKAVMKLADTLGKRVIGQDHAMNTIAKRIQTSRAGIGNPNRPIGVFLLAGPSGVGKTETALALAESLYGGEQNLITINMSEFQEAHTVSTLKGAPPGYVGYGEGGVLTEAVRRKPYSVILMDEVEKAHKDVHEIFFQVFDKGVMEDGEGRVIDFKNTVILLTSNVGSDVIMNMCNAADKKPDQETIEKLLRKPLLNAFPAAFLGRLVTIPYYSLSDEMLYSIIKLQFNLITNRMKDYKNINFSYKEDVVKLVAERCTEIESGARMIDSIITHNILPEISSNLLINLTKKKNIRTVELSTDESRNIIYKFK